MDGMGQCNMMLQLLGESTEGVIILVVAMHSLHAVEGKFMNVQH